MLSRPSRSVLVLAATVALFAPVGRSGLQDSADDPAAAAAELEKAEEEASKGRYKKAVSRYKRIAKKWGETPAGAVAKRRLEANALIGWGDILRTGPARNRVDIVVMGDGYLLAKQGSFDDLAGDVPRIFERDNVFEEYLPYLNIIRANLVSEDDGMDGYGREASTALDAKVTEGALQDQVSVDHQLVRQYLDQLPVSDGLAIVFVPRGSLGTGGGGVAAVGGRNPGTVIHEWGHAFGGLKDEYSTNTGFRGKLSSQVNVSDTADPKRVPWAHWIAAKVPGVGVYEGADGRVRGAWKPTAAGCIMAESEFFCRVCREALILRIHDFVDPIEGCTPVSHWKNAADEALSGDKLEFEVTVMRPKSHVLEARWWVLPADEAPTPLGFDPEADRRGPRRARGPLAPIDAKPVKVSKHQKKSRQQFVLGTKDMEPGRYRVVCRVVDPTKPRGERWPWVLKDERGVLESERAWWVVVGR